MYISIITALLSDPIQILYGLFLFTVSLFAIPLIFKMLDDIIIKLASFSFYMIKEFKEYLLPSTRTLENVQQHVEEVAEQPHQTHSPEEEKAEEAVSENTLDRVLNIVINTISNPRTWVTHFREDFDLSRSYEYPGYVIKFKLKILFFLFAAAGSACVLFIPGVAPVAVCALLIKWGLTYSLAQYAVVIITGGIIYASRTFFVALILLIKRLCRPEDKRRGVGEEEYQPLTGGPSENSERHPREVKEELSHTNIITQAMTSSTISEIKQSVGTNRENNTFIVNLNCNSCHTLNRFKIFFRPPTPEPERAQMLSEEREESTAAAPR